MNILSLFDGISCGQIALNKNGIKIDNYYASEIEPSAIKITQKNYPNTIQIGDITKISYKKGILYTENGNFKVGTIDMLLGGSPCSNFSSIGYANGMSAGSIEILTLNQYIELKNKNTKFDGQSYLFWEYVRLLKEIKPKYFLLENVVMAKKWENIITKNIGVSPIKINSSLLSAQNRPRLYWTNIENVTLPIDKKIKIEKILDKNANKKDVTYTKTVKKSLPKLIDKYGYIPSKFNAYNVAEIKDKACALSRGSMITSSCATLLFVKDENGIHTIKDGLMNEEYKVNLKNGKYNIRKLNLLEMERLQTLPDNYTKVEGVSDQKRSQAIGNGWTVNVISHILSFIKI